MSVKIILKEEKEQLNELLGTMIAWTLIAGLLAKLLGFKFNLKSDDRMREWGFQLGEAFKFSRRKMKNAGLSPEEQRRVDLILSAAEQEINDTVRRDTEAVRRSGGTHTPTADTEIPRICDEAVDKISDVIRDRRKAEEFVAPLRRRFDSLSGGLESMRREAVLNALLTDPGLSSAVRSSLGLSLIHI